MGKFAVIIPGAGQGERFGGEECKILAKLDGRPIFLRSIEHFVNREDVCQTILVVSGGDLKEIKAKYAANLGFMGVQIVEGGPTRCDSVRRALDALNEDAEFIAVHDAVRPCVSKGMIDRVFAEAAKTGAAILAAPLHGTIKRAAESGTVEATIPRENLYEAQTPQAFRRDILLDAYANAPETAENITDDAQLVELTERPVALVKSDPTNLKITMRQDVPLAAAILKARPPEKPTKALGAFEEAQW